jgi:hypothetical protein
VNHVNSGQLEAVIRLQPAVEVQRVIAKLVDVFAQRVVTVFARTPPFRAEGGPGGGRRRATPRAFLAVLSVWSELNDLKQVNIRVQIKSFQTSGNTVQDRNGPQLDLENCGQCGFLLSCPRFALPRPTWFS